MALIRVFVMPVAQKQVPAGSDGQTGLSSGRAAKLAAAGPEQRLKSVPALRPQLASSWLLGRPVQEGSTVGLSSCLQPRQSCRRLCTPGGRSPRCTVSQRCPGCGAGLGRAPGVGSRGLLEDARVTFGGALDEVGPNPEVRLVKEVGLRGHSALLPSCHTEGRGAQPGVTAPSLLGWHGHQGLRQNQGYRAQVLPGPSLATGTSSSSPRWRATLATSTSSSCRP